MYSMYILITLWNKLVFGTSNALTTPKVKYNELIKYELIKYEQISDDDGLFAN